MENFINGRKLIHVNCTYSPRLTNLKDMKVLGRRRLFIFDLTSEEMDVIVDTLVYVSILESREFQQANKR